MQQVGLNRPVQASDYDSVARLYAIYCDVESVTAWRDFQARIKAMRDDVASELLHGTLDKFGASRDNEKRAVLLFLDRQLAWVPALKSQFEELDKRRKEQEDKLKRRTGIHGEDEVNIGMGTGVRF